MSVLLALAACGGGGGGGGQPAAPQNPPPATTNAAPSSVTAGADQSITLPTNSVQLQGSAIDDGLPTPANLTYAWTVTSGSGVTFSNPAAAATTATFASAGTYVLTLTVSDGALSASDAVQVVVNQDTTGGNQAPVAQAGADQSIELPLTASLQGSATDDGLPGPLTYQWAVAGGATGVTFANAAAASTTASFAGAGTYELTLTASDGALTATDSVVVTVAAAVYPAADDESPDHGWTRVTAADVGMDQTLLDAAATVATTSGSAAGTSSAGMIVRRGRLVHSWGDIDRRFDLKSTTKSIGGMTLGLALDEGRLALADQAQSRLPGIGLPPPENSGTGWLDDITIQQLATHTAGFPKPGGFELMVYAPGTQWLYSDGGLNWLADLLTNVLSQDLATTLATRVWAVLGVDGANPEAADDVQWRKSVFRPGPYPDNIEHRELASGIFANVNTMARVGLLFLRNGAWSNQRVLSEAFVTTVRTPPAANAGILNNDEPNFPDATTSYGVLWWTNARGPSGRLPNVPADAYWAWGLGDSLIVVIPSLDLVIARAGQQATVPSPGRVWNDDDWNGDYSVLAPFLDPIVDSATP